MWFEVRGLRLGVRGLVGERENGVGGGGVRNQS